MASSWRFGTPFSHPGTTWGNHFGTSVAPLGSNFGTSGAPWEAILAPRDHPGGPWESRMDTKLQIK